MVALCVTCKICRAEDALPTIKSVATEADKRVLVIRYELEGVECEQHLVFESDIADYRWCRWNGGFQGGHPKNVKGIAIVAKTGMGDQSAYFLSGIGLTNETEKHAPYRIRAPRSDFPVLGIGNPWGDTIIVTAFRPEWDESERWISGWVMADYCPFVIKGYEPETTPLSTNPNPDGYGDSATKKDANAEPTDEREPE
jgi:hypothetical protein